MSNPPVLLLLFNRPALAAQVFEAIREARVSRLFIAVDGPRATHPSDVKNCADCRAFASMVDWPCEVRTLHRENNLGCLAAVTGALDWFFDEVEEGIILEDDCVPDPSFFTYCACLLERYRDDPRVLTIGGNNMGHGPLELSYGFTPFMNMWGWATWRNRAAKIKYPGEGFTTLRNRFRLFLALQRGRPHWWHIDYRWYLHWLGSFTKNVYGVTRHWDLPWIRYGLENWKVAIFPTSNLIRNIGFGDQATHTGDGSSPLAGLPTNAVDFPLIHPTAVRYSKNYELECIRRKWSGYSPSFIQDLRTMYYYTKLAFLREIQRLRGIFKIKV
jgi:hypothetical protein